MKCNKKRLIKLGRIFSIFFVSLCLLSCNQDGAKVKFLDSSGAMKGYVFSLEVADNEFERSKGLMYREDIAENGGMLFIFDSDAPRSFWMKNTPTSLDMIYINSNYKIVSIQKNTTPFSTKSFPSKGPAKYVIEVVAGVSDKIGLKPGDKVEIQF